jgi:hypothetical protein
MKLLLDILAKRPTFQPERNVRGRSTAESRRF